MRAYAMEFRESVAAARDDGMTTAEVAELFGCCASWVRRLLQGRRERGTLAPANRRLPDRREVGDGDRARLRAFLRRQPDATLAETAAALGLTVHRGTLSRVLAAMGLPRKKRRSGRPNRTGRTSGPPAPGGSRRWPASGSTGSCSSTSSGPRRT